MGFFVTLNGGITARKFSLEKQQSSTQGLTEGEVHHCMVAICLLCSWSILGCASEASTGPHCAMPT